MFMTLLDVTIVNIAIPAIISDMHTTVANASWVIDAYSLTLAVLFLSMGSLADKLGRKLVFLVGLSVFSIFSLLCGLAPTIGWLVVFRVGQGIGGAAMTPLSLAILLSVFPRRQHGMAVGIWGGLTAIAGALGPSLGGLLIEYGSWHWVFFINVPIGVGAFIFGWFVLPKVKEALSEARVDYRGRGHLGGGPVLPCVRAHPGQRVGMDVMAACSRCSPWRPLRTRSSCGGRGTPPRPCST